MLFVKEYNLPSFSFYSPFTTSFFFFYWSKLRVNHPIILSLQSMIFKFWRKLQLLFVYCLHHCVSFNLGYGPWSFYLKKDYYFRQEFGSFHIWTATVTKTEAASFGYRSLMYCVKVQFCVDDVIEESLKGFQNAFLIICLI